MVSDACLVSRLSSFICACSSLDSQAPSMLLFSALSGSPFRTVRLRSRRSTCPSCSIEPEALKKQIGVTDYVSFCGGKGENARITGDRAGITRITPMASRRYPRWLNLLHDGDILQDLHHIREISRKENSEGPLHVLIDVRPRVEFGICHLPQSISSS